MYYIKTMPKLRLLAVREERTHAVEFARQQSLRQPSAVAVFNHHDREIVRFLDGLRVSNQVSASNQPLYATRKPL